MRTAILPIAALAMGAMVPAAAQEPAPKRMDVTVSTFDMPMPPPPPGAGLHTFEYVGAEVGISGKVVKGAPYSATAVTESVQTLADGNRITNTMTSSVARDSEGRTRREQSIPAIGPWASDGAAAKLVTVNDPVGGVTYMLDDNTKTARKLPAAKLAATAKMMAEKAQARVLTTGGMAVAGGVGMAGGVAMAGEPGTVMIRHAGPGASPEGMPAPKVEKLAATNIEGVMAEGTRTTLTIPAGAAGNERALEIVDEQWYSSELQTTVLSKHSDPRMGETTFRLTKVSRAEPSPSLFEVPADYKVVDAGSEPVFFKVEDRGNKTGR